MAEERMVKVRLVEAQMLPTTTSAVVNASVDFEVDDFLFIDNQVSLERGKEAVIPWPWGDGRSIQFREIQRRDTETQSKQEAVENKLRTLIAAKLKDLEKRIKK